MEIGSDVSAALKKHDGLCESIVGHIASPLTLNFIRFVPCVLVINIDIGYPLVPRYYVVVNHCVFNINYFYFIYYIMWQNIHVIV